MTAREFLDHLSVSGIRLSVTDGTLKVDAPAGVLTAELKTELTTQKPELLRLLAPKLCPRCNDVMACVEAGYFACDCGFQLVEAYSGFWRIKP